MITLREAMQAADANAAVGDAPAGCPFGSDIITFAPELFTDGVNPLPGTITLGKGLSITDPAGVDIQGPGAKLLTIDVNKTFKAFTVNGSGGGLRTPAEASLSGMTITRAKAMYRYGVVSNFGSLTLVDMNISGNAGCGVYNNGGSLFVIDSTISGNSYGGVFYRGRW